MKSAPPPSIFSWMRHLHAPLVFRRRARILAEILSTQIPHGASVLDVGCGDGTISDLVMKMRPDLSIQGVEVMARPDCKINCTLFDGTLLPFPDTSFDVCVFVDVLHHSRDLRGLLHEANRVSRDFVLLKDHLSENLFDRVTLGFMDWVGNRPYGVHLAYDFQSRAEWLAHFRECGLGEESWTSHVPLYPAPFSFLFGRELHFVSLLRKTNQSCREPLELSEHPVGHMA
jgi:SAM-dependent methyltransferase